MSVGIFLRLTHTGQTATSLFLSDVNALPREGQIRRAGAVYVPLGGSVDLHYTSDVIYSLESGVIRGFIDQGYLTADLHIGDLMLEGLPETNLPFTEAWQLLTFDGQEPSVVGIGGEGQVLTVQGDGSFTWAPPAVVDLPFATDWQILTQIGGDLDVVSLGDEGQVLTVQEDGTFAWAAPEPGVTPEQEEKLDTIVHGQSSLEYPLGIGSRNANAVAGFINGMASITFQAADNGEWRWTSPKLPGYTGGDAVLRVLYSLPNTGGVGDTARFTLDVLALPIGGSINDGYSHTVVLTEDLEAVPFRTIQTLDFVIPEAELQAVPSVDVIFFRLTRLSTTPEDTYGDSVFTHQAVILYDGWGQSDDLAPPGE